MYNKWNSPDTAPLRQPVLVMLADGSQIVTHKSDDFAWRRLKITHWMPLPDPPMTVDDAIKIVEEMQVWRLGADIPMPHASKEFTRAIEMLLDVARDFGGDR